MNGKKKLQILLEWGGICLAGHLINGHVWETLSVEMKGDWFV